MTKLQFRYSWDYLKDISEAAAKLSELTEEMTFASFSEDWRVHYAALSLLEAIGDAAGCIPGDFCRQYPAVPWVALKGMSKALERRYAAIQPKVIWDTLQNNIPPLREAVTEVLGTHAAEPQDDDQSS